MDVLCNGERQIVEHVSEAVCHFFLLELCVKVATVVGYGVGIVGIEDAQRLASVGQLPQHSVAHTCLCLRTALAGAEDVKCWYLLSVKFHNI